MDVETPPSKSLGTVLVVGGCGFLGSHVVDQLLGFPSEESAAPSAPEITKNGYVNGSSKSSSTHRLSTSPPPDPADLTWASLRSRYPSYVTTAVHVLDISCRRNRFAGATYHEADISDPASLLAVFRRVKPEVVVNTASPTYDAPHAILRKVNIEGIRTLVEVAGGVHGEWGGKCKAFVHTSSSSVVHDTLSDLVNVDERWPLVNPNPREYYSETKAVAETTVLSMNRKHNGMLTCAVRPAGIVGENDRGGPSYLITYTGAVAPSWQLHFQLGQGSNLFDLTYVGNVAYGLLCAAQGLLATYERISSGLAAPLDHEKVDGEAFIVTNDQPIYFWDMSRYLWTLYGKNINMSRVVTVPENLGIVIGALAELTTLLTGRKSKITRQSVRYSCMTRYYNCKKLQVRCGYRPVVGIEEGLQRSVKSFVVNERAEKVALAGQDAVEKKNK